jgi:hypothetical protein
MPRAAMRVSRKEDDVARRDLAHGLVEGIAGFVSVALGRPEIAAGDFVAVGLVLVDPPVAHQRECYASSPIKATMSISLSCAWRRSQRALESIHNICAHETLVHKLEKWLLFPLRFCE